MAETATQVDVKVEQPQPMANRNTYRSVYFNGKMVPEHEARVSIFDSSLMFGDMAFEMTRTYNHEPFCLREHLDRLYASLKMMRIDPGMNIDEMEQATRDVLAANIPTETADVDWQIMHDVSRGTMGIYHTIGGGGDNDGGPTVSINCWPLITHQGSYAPNYENGVDLVVSAVTQLPAHLLDLKAKTRSRLHYQMAILNSELFEHHVDPVLMDPDGFLAEGPGWNIFLVKSGVLYTPEGRNALIGVSRQNTIKIAESLGIPVVEKNLGRYEAMTADEIFITSTTKALCWAASWEGAPVGDGQPGPIYGRLMAGWQEHVSCDFVAQAWEYNSRLEGWRELDAKKHAAHQARLAGSGGVHTVGMGQRPIPGTALTVSPICLGSMTFGVPVGQTEATAMIKRALELGVNFIDTANMYEGYTRSVGSAGEAAEKIIGVALRSLGVPREAVVVATKVGMLVERDGLPEGGLSAKHIHTECARSLARLQLDCIDIYYAHKPDEDGVPLTETIGAFAELIAQRKVKHWAVSNFEPSQLVEVLELCDANSWPRPVMHQPAYSLLNRGAEEDLLPLCQAEGIAVAPYQIYQGGLLTGKYRAGAAPPVGSRATESQWLSGKLEHSALEKVALFERVAAQEGMGLLEYVVRRTAATAGITSLIVGATKVSQIEAAVAALGGVRDTSTHRPKM